MNKRIQLVFTFIFEGQILNSEDITLIIVPYKMASRLSSAPTQHGPVICNTAWPHKKKSPVAHSFIQTLTEDISNPNVFIRIEGNRRHFNVHRPGRQNSIFKLSNGLFFVIP